MHKTILITLAGILVFGSALSVSAATNQPSSTPTINQNVTVADLGVQNVGTLPTSKWYFFKEWRRDIQRLFIVNPVAKAEFELQITNEKAAELIEVQEGGKNDGEALRVALENYTKAHDKLSARLADVKESSNNPNVAKLLEKVGLKTAQQTALLNQVSERWHSDPYAEDSARKVSGGEVDITRITNALKNAQEKIQDTVIVAALKDTDIKQKAAIEIAHAEEAVAQAARIKAGLDTAGGMLANGASVIGGLVPGGAIISAAVSSVSQLGGHTAGGGAASSAYAKSATLQVTGSPGGAVQNRTDDGKDATSTASRHKLWLTSNFRLSELLTNAKDHLARAKKAFGEDSYGEAFGLAQSAEVMAVEASRISTNMTSERQTPKRDFGDRAVAGHKFNLEIDGVLIGSFEQGSGIEGNLGRSAPMPGDDTAAGNRPGRTKYANIVLKRGTVNDASLLEWHKKVLAGTTDRKSGSVIYLDREDKEILRYNFFEAWPVRLVGATTNPQGTGYTIEQLELEVGRIEKTGVATHPVRSPGGLKDTLQTQVIKVPPPIPEPKPRSIPENSIESNPVHSPEGRSSQ